MDEELIKQIKENSHISTVYECNTVQDFVFWEFYTLLKNNAKVKRCAYCQKLFISKGDYDTDCCDRIHENGKTCKKMMTIKRRKDKLKTSPIAAEYERAYKRMYARVSNGKMEKEEFRLWGIDASQKRDLAEAEYIKNHSDKIISDFKTFLGNK